MKAKRFLALLLSVIMVIGVIPLNAIQVHAAEHTWNPDATMTLKCGDAVVEPNEVIETADTKMKIYRVESKFDYTLTTTDDNDYAVLFEVNWSVIAEDEYGYKDYDYEMTVTLDNVTIRTYNPRADQDTGVHAAMMFSDEKSEERYETLNIELVGNNTVELLGVENDSVDDFWSAVGFIGPNTVIKGDGTLNASCCYENAVGAVSALYTENSVGLYDSVTLNATADVKAKEADTLIGDGLYFDDYEFIMETGTTANVKASGSGIMHGTEKVRATWLDNMDIDGALDICAADYGISWQAGGIILGDGASLSIKGLTDASAPNVGILVRRDVIVGAGCTFNVDALGAAYSCRASTTANPSAPLTIGEGSVAVLNGSISNSDFVVDCGTDFSGKNNVVSGTGEEWYGETWHASELTLESGAKLTINGGYRALQALLIDLYEDSELKITTSDVVDSTDIYEYGPIYLSSSTSNIYSGAALTIETPAEQAIYGYSKMNILSNNVYIKAGETALSSSIARGSGIYTFESDDGVSWTPFANKNSKPYFTTNEPATHICAASIPANTYSNKVWTPIENEDKHTAKCIYCASDIVADCQWDRGVWSYNSGNYILKFECEICEQERLSDVEYHSHVYETWTPVTDSTNYMHESTCTVEGCGASTEEYCSNSYGAEYHVDVDTMRKDCTKCGQFTEWEFDSSTVKTTHYEAKPASCNGAGNVEFWHCAHCNRYYADEACTNVLDPSEAFIQPTAHNYSADGVCTVCGAKNLTLSFVPEEGFPNEYDYYYAIIAKASNGKYYVMGNKTVNGKREAVEIPGDMIGANGTITLTAEMAEYLYFETVGTSNTAWMADGGCFSFTAEDGFFVYDKSHYGDKCVSYPGYFYPGWDEPGLGEMYAFDKDYDEKVWLYFNEEELCFDISETEMQNIYFYIQICEHSGLYHNKAADPTCTEQGTREYYGCGKCGAYYVDASATIPYEFPEYIDPFNQNDVNEYFNIPALRHKFNSEGVCENCGMLRNVYRPVNSLEQFDQLSNDAYYIIVFRDGDKTYAAFLPDIEHINDPSMLDANNNGIVDLMEPDVNENSIPDCIESYIDNNWGSVDYNEDGIKSVEEYNEAIGWMDVDEDVDTDDYKLFFKYNVARDLYYEYEYQEFEKPNIVEVTVAPDGSITIVDEGAMEFQMMPSGVWGGQPYDEYDFEHFGILDTERIRAAWVPNWWIANDGMMGEYGVGHFMYQNRWYGDCDVPGITDNKNWKISFNADGTALLVSTWTDFDDSAALKLVKYTDEYGNERITMVGCYGERWEYSDILSNCTVISDAYLYASEPVYLQLPHECNWGDWEDDDVTDTHTRRCTVDGCNEKQTEKHNWNNGVETETPTCTESGKTLYTCPDCKATKTELIDALDHDWDEWTYDSVDSHIRYCKRETCDAEDYGGHEWGEWKSVDENTHKMTCSICTGEQMGEHDFDNGIVTKEPTCREKGIKTYTCTVCGHTYTEDIPETTEHQWTDWSDNKDGTHTRSCRCNANETVAHTWGGWVIQNDGGYKRECADCGAFETMTLSEDKPVNITPTTNAANTNLTNTDIELIEKVLSDEEQSRVAEGAEVKVYLKVEDISNEVPVEHKNEAEAKAGDDEVGMYLDIELFKQIGTASETPVTETDGAVSITITIPENLINTDSSVTRTYKIIRVHEDKNGTLITDVIEGVFNPEDNTFTFETDKFSTYALVYTKECINYTVVFQNWDGTELSKTIYHYGDIINVPADPQRADEDICSYTFAGWDKEVSATCVGNAVYTAVYDVHYFGFFVSGTVTSFGVSDGEVTIKLMQNDAEVVSAVSTDGTYSLLAPKPGSYNLVVSKLNHATRTYEITVEQDNIPLNLKIHLKGDINGDGKVNVSDVGKANAHAKKTKLLEGYEFACADINGDGRINVSDVGKMNAHAKKTVPLW